MRIDAGQHLRIDQRMKLAPRMIHSMEILQMPSLALEERIGQELSNNPTLELSEPTADADLDRHEQAQEKEQAERDNLEGERELLVREGSQTQNNADDFERLSNLAEEYGDSWAANTYETGGDFARSTAIGERDKKLDAMANTAARGQSLADQLLSQWALVDAPADIVRAGQYLIGFIDDDGYLRTDHTTLAKQCPQDVRSDDLDEALRIMQTSFEPPGLAARDLRECLLIQIDARIANRAASNGSRDTTDLIFARLLVNDHLKDIEANRLPRIAKQTGMTVDQIKQAITGLRQFHPHPGRLLVEDRPQTITPDAIIDYDDDEDRYVARLTRDRFPGVRINHRYLRMIRDGKIDTRTKDFINNNLRSARWLIDAIEQRHSTLLRVINVVLAAQREYFDHGPQHLKPLPMTQVADQLGIHVATVSRAVNQKYLQTPRGIVPLRMFFSGGTQTEAGEGMSWAAIQAKLKQIIGEEDKTKPLSDDALVEKLKAHGIDIARRTVAKYRSQLNILPARQRKQY